MVKYFFPQAKVLALRAPHSATAIELGQAVAAVAQELKVSILVFGSTDLTHYGPNYGFAPKGYGPEAVKWVKEVNDKKFIDQALKLDGPGMLKAAQQDQSACSAGGAVAAVAAAKAARRPQSRPHRLLHQLRRHARRFLRGVCGDGAGRVRGMRK